MTMTGLSDLRSATEIAADESRDPNVLAELERTAGAERRWLARAHDAKDDYRPESLITGDE
jgi:hypothetical protein